MTIQNDTIGATLHDAGRKLVTTGKAADGAVLALASVLVQAVDAEYTVEWQNVNAKGVLLASGVISIEAWTLNDDAAFEQHKRAKNAAIYDAIGIEQDTMTQTVRNNLNSARLLAAGAIQKQSLAMTEGKSDFYRIGDDGLLAFNYQAVMPETLESSALPSDPQKMQKAVQEHLKKRATSTYESPKAGAKLGMSLARIMKQVAPKREGQGSDDAAKGNAAFIKACELISAQLDELMKKDGEPSVDFMNADVAKALFAVQAKAATGRVHVESLKAA